MGVFNISVTYPDLDNTKFPDAIDDFEKFIDPSIDEIPLITQFQDYFDNQQIDDAVALLEQYPILKRMIINAANLNKLRDMNIAVQRFFMNDIHNYLVAVTDNVGNYNSRIPIATTRPSFLISGDVWFKEII